jgi:ribonuclease HI
MDISLTNMKLPNVRIITDGACSPNPGIGGWCAILVQANNSRKKVLSGAEENTTNNRMELIAAIEGLRSLLVKCNVVIKTDSRYVHDAFDKDWIKGWKKKGWQTAKGQPVKNDDLWKELVRLVDSHNVTWEWVRGHDLDDENEEADEGAVAARVKLAASLQNKR